MIQSIRLGALALVLATYGCKDRDQCQDFTTVVVETGSAMMERSLDQPHFETVLTRISQDIENLHSIPQLEGAKREYRKSMAKAVSYATAASANPAGPAVATANASARAEAAKATYHLVEMTNLHCAGER
jgi:hypothetical protein